MKKRILIVVLFLLLCIVLIACEPVRSIVEMASTQVGSVLATTQTAQELTISDLIDPRAAWQE